MTSVLSLCFPWPARQVPRRSTGWLLGSLVLLATACADPSAQGTVIEPDDTAETLLLHPWHWEYITAALGGDETNWLVFGDDGVVERVVRRWVYDGDGESSYPVTRASGTYSIDASGELSMTIDDHLEVFTVAVLDDAVARRFVDGEARLVHKGPAFTTRAYRRLSDGRWRGHWRSEQPSRTSATTVTMSLDPDAASCSVSITLDLSQTIDGITRTAAVSLAPLSCEVVRDQQHRLVTVDAISTWDKRNEVLAAGVGADALDEGLTALALNAMEDTFVWQTTRPALLVTALQDWSGLWWTPKAPPSE